MSELYKKVERFIEESFANTKHIHTVIHSKLAVDALKELEPHADEAMCIAVLAHDIDRAFIDRAEGLNGSGYKEQPYLKNHQEGSAKIIKDFLEKNGANKKLVERVWHLVSKHEEGGDKDQDLIKDADSLSFFRGANTNSILNKYPKMDIRGKIDWMFNRITSEKAKELAKSLYEKDIKGL